MASIRSIQAYSRFPQYHSPADEVEEHSKFRRHKTTKTVETPCCVTLHPTEAVDPNAVGVALLSARREDIPRRYGISVLAAELPSPSSLGDFDIYEAVLFEPGVVSFVVTLSETPNHAWAGTLGGISLAFSPTMRLILRPANTESGASGPTLLAGDVATCRG